MRNKLFQRILFPALTCLLSVPAMAQNKSIFNNGTNIFIIFYISFALIAFLATVYLVSISRRYQRESNIKAGTPGAPVGLRKWWNNLDKKFFTKAAPLEKEADVLLDHDYDGIRELDNALPPWWKWGFYITLIAGVIYLLRFHVWNTGPSPLDEYNKEIMIAEVQLEKYRKTLKDDINETNVTLADAAGIEAGKKLFLGICNTCHGNNGEGNVVGPNLTDKYWLHGGSLQDVFRTIKAGVPEKGMQSWEKTYTPAEIRNLASFIMSLQGSNPVNAKEPQGELYVPGETITDSLPAARNDTAVNAAPQ